MRISVEDIKKRKTYSDNRQYGIMNYDRDNLYPQHVIDIINNSGVATACVELFAKYLFGDGIEQDIIVNREGHNLDDILSFAANDFAKLGGFALHFNYNGELKINEIQYVPFEYCRLTKMDDTEYSGKVAIYNDWGREKWRKIKPENIDYIDVFNPYKNVMQLQIEKAGGLRDYKGQVLYFSTNKNQYPLAPIDSVLEDAMTSGEIKNFKYKSVTSNFMANTMFIHKGTFEDESQRNDFKQTLKKFQGADASKFMLVEAEREEAIPEIREVATPNNDKIFELTEKTVKDNIIQSFGQPPILLGVYTPGSLGATKEMRDAQIYYNLMTRAARMQIERVFNDFLKYSVFPIDFKIIEIIPIEDGQPDTI